MTSGNQVVSRLQQQRSRIQGMLSPGRKDQPEGIHAPLSPVKSDFAGRKFLIAAKKMRVLGENKLSRWFSRSGMSLSTEIANKFQDVEKIIHINPKTIGDGSIWSDVDTTLPGGIQPVNQSTRPEVGVLQQGSVIQKFNTVPKPGQSIESFRKQIESQPRPSKISVSHTKKAALSPGDRLFSKVQEITPSHKGTGIQKQESQSVQEIPIENTPPKEMTDQTANKPPIQSQAVDSPGIMQREVDLPISENQPEEISDAPVKTESQRQEDVRKNLPDPELTALKKQYETEPVIVTEQSLAGNNEEDQPASTEFPVANKLAPKPELKKAIPVKKDKRVEKQPPAMKALPVVKPIVDKGKATVLHRQPAPPIEPLPAKPLAAESKPKKDPVEGITEKTTTIEKQPFSKHDETAILPKVSQEDDRHVERLTENEARVAEIEDEEIPLKIEVDPVMPLRQFLADRQQAAKGVLHRAEPVKPPKSQQMLLTRSSLPLLPSRKNRRTEVAESKMGMPAARQFSPTFQAGGAQTISMDDLPIRPAEFEGRDEIDKETNQQELIMPIAEKKFIPENSATIERRVKQTDTPKQSTQVSRPASANTAVTNIVQRQWEEHTGVEGQSSGGASSHADGDDHQSSSLDLEALAEDVIPFVKRILEIEMDRGSGKFR